MSSSAAIARVFDGVAAGYDAELLQRVVYRPNHDLVLRELRRLGARRIVDVGCGTGILTTRIERELAPDELHGCDPSDGMLAKARARSAGVAWHAGAAERLPLPDGAADAVVTTEAFHFFDQPAALAEFHRVLEPGGHLVIVSTNAGSDLLGALLRLTPTRFTTTAGVRRLCEDAGFEVVAQRRARPGLLLAWPANATIARRPAEAPAARAAPSTGASSRSAPGPSSIGITSVIDSARGADRVRDRRVARLRARRCAPLRPRAVRAGGVGGPRLTLVDAH